MNNKENCKKGKGYIMKRFLSILFAFTVLFTSIPINAIATSEEDDALIKSNEIQIDLAGLEEERISFKKWRDTDDIDSDTENEENKYKKNNHDYVIIKLKDEDRNKDKEISCTFRNQENSWLDYFVHDDNITVYSEDKDKKIEKLNGLVAVGDKVYYINEEFNDSIDEPENDSENDSENESTNDPADPGRLAGDQTNNQEGTAGEGTSTALENEEVITDDEGTSTALENEEAITDDEGTPTALENKEVITDEKTITVKNELFNSGNSEEK